jgi:hypothetical protein
MAIAKNDQLIYTIMFSEGTGTTPSKSQGNTGAQSVQDVAEIGIPHEEW